MLREMFFTVRSPRSAKRIDSLSRICSFAEREMQTPPGSHNASRPGGHVYAVPKDVISVNQNVADVDANAKHDAAILWQGSIAADHAELHRNRTGYRIDNAAELGEEPIACSLYDAPVMSGNRRIDQLAAVRLETAQRANLVVTH
jgi:hypothetical protein